MERDGLGGKREKINQGGPDPGLMSRRTCANRSGSLAGGGWLAESIRIFCHTTLIRRLCTLTPYLLYFPFASLPPLFFIIIFIFLLLVPSLRCSANLVILPLLSCITFPSFPLDSCSQLKPSCQPSTRPVLFPHSIPTSSSLSLLPSLPNP